MPVLCMAEPTALQPASVSDWWNWSEIINPDADGEATAMYLTRLIKPYVDRITRIAYGVPLGGELEYVDLGTIAQAFRERRPV